MRKRITELTIATGLALTWPCLAATYYVDYTAGTDDGSHGSAAGAGAWKTLQYAIDHAPTGTHTIYLSAETHAINTWLSVDADQNDKDLTLVGAGAAATVLTTTHANNAMLLYATWTSGRLHLQDLTVTGNKTGGQLIGSSSTMPLACTRCTLHNDAATPVFWSNAASSVLFTDCHQDSQSGLASLTSSGATYQVVGGTFTWGSAGTFDFGVRISGSPAEVSLRGTVISGPYDTGYIALIGNDTAPAGYIGDVSITDCTGVAAQLLNVPAGDTASAYIRRFQFAANTLTFTAASHTLFFGNETDGGTATTNPNPFQSILILDNTITFANPAVTHLIFLGVGADNAYLAQNTFICSGTSSNWGLVCKANRMVCARNVFVNFPSPAVYLSGAQDCRVVQNTIQAAGTGTACHVDTNQDGVACTRNVIELNVLLSDTGLALGYDSGGDSAGDTWSNRIDRNLYWSGGTDIANLGGTTVAKAGSAAGLAARWAAYGSAHWTLANDAHSAVESPRLDTHYRPGLGSPLSVVGRITDRLVDGVHKGAWPRRPAPSQVFVIRRDR